MLCVAWKISAGVCFTTAYAGKRKFNKQTNTHGTDVIPKSGLGLQLPEVLSYKSGVSIDITSELANHADLNIFLWCSSSVQIVSMM